MNRADFEPTEADLADPMFDVIWNGIKSHDVPYGESIFRLSSGATGNDVMMILRPLREIVNHLVVNALCEGHGDGQEHAIADVNAGRIDDLIAPRLKALREGAAKPLPTVAARICGTCPHPIKDHVYSWSGPWDWWECPCGCKIGE